MSRTEEPARAIRTQHENEHGDEPACRGALTKQFIETGKDILEITGNTKLSVERALGKRTEQGGGNAFARYIGENAGKVAVFELDEVVEIAAHLAGGPTVSTHGERLKNGEVERQQTALGLFRQGQFAGQLAAFRLGLHHADFFQHVTGFIGKLVENFSIYSRQLVHDALTVEVKNSGDFRRIGFSRNGNQRQTGYGAEVHGYNAFLFGHVGFDAAGHEYRLTGFGNPADGTLAGAEAGFLQQRAGTIHTEGVVEAARTPAQNEAPFGAADLQGRLQDLMEHSFGREGLVEAIVEVENTGNLLQFRISI